MKKILLMATVFVAILGLNSCSKENTNEIGLSQEVISAIAAKGFNPSDAFATDGGYIVEGDIFLTEEDLFGNPFTNPFQLIVGNSEQYNTTDLVTGLPRTIVVSTSGSIANALSTAIDAAIARYNAENLQLTFVRGGSSGGGDINIRGINTRQYIASAGFPSGGNPYNEVLYSTRYINGYSQGFITTVVAHEIGHCIGFRHTDYMNRAYSCGSGGNEGSAGVGAIHIPGTPTGPDPNSWMLACLGASTNRPFNANDKTALSYLY